jgi:hypothetical protein
MLSADVFSRRPRLWGAMAGLSGRAAAGKHRRSSRQGATADARMEPPPSFADLLACFRSCFTAPTFQTFIALAAGFIAQPGSRTVTGMLVGARWPYLLQPAGLLIRPVRPAHRRHRRPPRPRALVSDQARPLGRRHAGGTPPGAYSPGNTCQLIPPSLPQRKSSQSSMPGPQQQHNRESEIGFPAVQCLAGPLRRKSTQRSCRQGLPDSKNRRAGWKPRTSAPLPFRRRPADGNHNRSTE